MLSTSAATIVWCAGPAGAQAVAVSALVQSPPLTTSPPQAGPAPARAARRVKLSIGLTVNGAPAGEVTVDTDAAGDASIDTMQLLARLEKIISPSILDQLKLRIANRPFAPVSELRSEDVPLIFDLAGLQLRLDLPMNARATNVISVQDRSAFGSATPIDPSSFAAGATLTLSQRLQHSRGFGGIDRDPALLAVRGFANYGGKDGVYLTFLGGIREDNRFFRRGTTLFHDDVENAVRFSIGDLDPQTTGSYQTSSNLLGIGVERSYQDIQPYRNLRPAGRGALTLERPSRVDVMVNGALYRTLTLPAGQYDLRDFPFLNGLNDVQLNVTDDSGRNERLNLSFFSDTLLLDQGVSLFSANIGQQQDSFSQFSSTRYRHSPMFSGYYVRGVTDRLTLGGSAQADRDNILLTAQFVLGTPIGIIGIEGALDNSDFEKKQYSGLVSYRLNSVSGTGRQNILAIDFAIRSAKFSPMVFSDDRANPYRYDINARYQRTITETLYATASFSYGKGRDPIGDLVSGSMGLSRSFGRVSVGGTYTYRSDDRGKDHRFNLTLSIPLGTNQSLRTNYNSHRNRIAADYSLIGYEGLDQTSAEATVYREDGGKGVNVAVDHYFNRFRASVTHDYQSLDGVTTQTSDLAVSMGVGYADGRLALGRDADRGFTIVAGHPTLHGAPIEVSSRYSLGPAARTGVLGPALVPVQRGYQPDVLEVKIANAPAGYDIGAGRIDILPGAASGYSWVIGSAASHTLIASLVDGKGVGIPYLAGLLTPLSGKDAVPTQFFTNKTGRLVAQKLAPGDYALRPAGYAAPIATVTVTEDAASIVNAGTIVVKDYQP
ncbi:fimbrial biogenesis outer membrane usher protein [Sphingomonas sp. So64.6b]|uniref:fimbria/pilus outer membrane usher protein n=1 Tax=Sphingomonas sp. So64.6b TaxID=2997354 RepID=UPI0015FFABA9|nr:fimbria/pilus outer membrane usher protein [Sphingomonas sp. So64.6b]QNA82977.1 fimbrial biogenesis outer membrane usher protein [Sphingomonas sp. So64.6b]